MKVRLLLLCLIMALTACAGHVKEQVVREKELADSQLSDIRTRMNRIIELPKPF